MEHDLKFVNSIPPISPNSRLGLAGDKAWGINDTPFWQYAADAVFPYYPEGLEGIIQEKGRNNSNNVGLDIAGGSQGRALRDLMESGILAKGLVTNLEDLRTPDTKADTRLSHIAGDLAIRQTWENIINWQTIHAPDGLSIIMHRPMGGLQNFGYSAYLGAAHTLLDMLRPGGIFFTQVPRTSRLSRSPDTICQSLLTRPDVEKIVSTTPASLRPGNPHFSIIIKVG